MEIVSIERKTFEEMKERFGCFSQHVRELCARYRPPEKMNWMDGADVCEKLGISKRTLQTYRDRGLLPYSQINHKIYYRTEDVEAFVEAMSREMTEDERDGSDHKGHGRGTGVLRGTGGRHEVP